MRLTVLVYPIICLWHNSLAVQTCAKEYIQPYNCSVLADYYWRDYDGTVPNDAVIGGSDGDKITYVGQVSDREWILPANIYPCEKEALTNGYGKGFRTSKSVKVLCTQYKDRLRWITTSLNEMHLLTDFDLVVAGQEVGYALNVGRANFEQRVITGKIFPNHSPHKGFHVAKRNGKEQTLHPFEILAFEKRSPQFCNENCNC